MATQITIMMIGTELVRGELPDTNHRRICQAAMARGVEVASVHMVRDEVRSVAALVRWLSPQTDFVLTVGGLGPTLDDVTMAGIAEAFGLALISLDPKDPSDYAEMSGSETRRSRLRHRPYGSQVVQTGEGPVVRTRNVFSLPGLPRLVEARLPAVWEQIGRGAECLEERELRVAAPQSRIAGLLERVSLGYPDVSIGCYPGAEGQTTSIMINGEPRDEVEACLRLIKREIEALGLGILE